MKPQKREGDRDTEKNDRPSGGKPRAQETPDRQRNAIRESRIAATPVIRQMCVAPPPTSRSGAVDDKTTGSVSR